MEVGWSAKFGARCDRGDVSYASRVVTLQLLELVYPHRMDIALRVHALQAFDRGGRRAMLATPYARFIGLKLSTTTAPHVPVEKCDQFIDLYQSIQESWEPDKNLSVVDRGGPHPAYLPPEKQTATMTVPHRYSLAQGAHRVAILLHLGHREWEFAVDSMRRVPIPDYTTFLAGRATGWNLASQKWIS